VSWSGVVTQLTEKYRPIKNKYHFVVKNVKQIMGLRVSELKMEYSVEWDIFSYIPMRAWLDYRNMW